MDILFLLTGCIFSFIVPIVNLNVLGFKGFVYCFIMILFSILVLAYTILSIYKYKISKIDYLKSKTIVSWDNGKPDTKNSRLPFIISLVSGLLLGIFVYFNSIGLLNSILLSLACAFIVLGWWLMGRKRLENKINSTDTFLLSHTGIIYNGKVEIFNGFSKGITSAKKEDNYLILTILKNKKQTELKFIIPSDKTDAVTSFLKDMNEYFSGESDEK